MNNWLKTLGAMALGLALAVLPARADENVEKPSVPAPAPAAVEIKPAAPEPEQVVIDYNDADIQSVLRTLATKAGINLIMADEVIGKVTVHLEGVGYEDAIRLICESKGYGFVKDKTAARIKSKDSLENEPLEVRVETLNYAKAADLAKTLESVLTKRGKIQFDVRSNTLIVQDTPSNLNRVMPLMERLDGPTPQVLIEARFVETTKNPKKDLGISWDQTLLNHELSAGPFNLSKDLSGGPWVPSTALLDAGSAKLVFSFLNQDTDTELLANPRVVTTDNGHAKIAIATQYPIPRFSFSESSGAFQIAGFEYKDIGIVLNVTPRINKNDNVTLEVSPEASSQSGIAKLASGASSVDIPIIDTRQALTTVLIKSGNTLAIGGLMRQDVSDKYSKVPIMGDLPGIGALFRSKSLSKTKRDLLIFLTPTIIAADGQTGYEKHVAGVPREELYTNDKFLPNDNAKPKVGGLKDLIPFRKTTSQNFGSN